MTAPKGTRTAPADDYARLAAAARRQLTHLVRAAVGAIAEVSGPLPQRRLATVVRTVEVVVVAAIDSATRPGPGSDAWRGVLRDLGAAERRAGRGLEHVESATRAATRAVWHGLVDLGQRADVHPGTLVAAVDDLFGFSEAACAAAREGHESAAVPAEPARARLLDLLTGPRRAPDAAELADLAAAAGWPVPERVAALVAERPVRPVPLDARVLVSGDDRVFLLPAGMEPPAALVERPDTPGRGVRFALGLPVPVAEAGRSVDYARRLLDLVARGALPPAPVTRGADHLTALLTAADDGLLRWIRSVNLGPLAELSEARRAKLLTTLALWLRFDGDVREVAKRVHLHPQSVRYRLHQVRDLLGESALEGERRFLLHLALRTRTIRR
ncbi:PucR family transcriptional regulator [Actinokineospora sp. G85]|uniref:PucR family transcriptional regulator n=1 Tax=Actinokineospora sp. G85 TaxID=3406626 RepID=UPI003C7860B3